MYGVKWDKKTRGIKLITSGDGDISPLIRPVFHEELDLLGFNRYWKYPKSKEPLLWSVGRYYFYDGVKVARVKGGGFYENPQLEVFEDNLELEPVDIEKMIRKNREIMENVVHTTLDFISEIYSEYINRVDKVVVAFSGGKDSAVLLDLVQRVLAPDEYIVMFNDTTMELSPTYKFVEIIKQRYPNLNFYTARYKKPAIEMWREVGIPSRVHRWCCTIYKTVPTIKTIQKLVNKETPRVLLYDGIRADESPSRAKLSQISRGKHLQQINVHPIIDWNSAIVYLYTFMRDLPLNELYRYGTVRVGCAVCPFGSNWKEAILWLKFNEEIKPYLNLIEKYAKFRCRGEGLEDFIREGAWKKRIGGANLGVSDKITILEENNQTKIIIHHPNIKNWFEWFKAVGDVTVINPSGYVVFDKAYYGFSFYSDSRELKIVFDSALPKDLIYYLKNAAYKVAYCIKCGTCEVECPNSAIEIRTDKIKIDEEKCTKCHKCLSFVDRGCIVADSFRISLVVDKMSKNTSLSRYKFGIRKEWLEEFFSDPEKWWVENSLGPVQFEAMKLWLIDAEIIAVNENVRTLTEIGRILKKLGANNLLTWNILWVNLAENSPLIKWYIQKLRWGETYSREELFDALGDTYRERTKKNAITALFQVFKYTPFGDELYTGVPIKRGKTIIAIEKKGVPKNKLDPIAVLYSLYKYAEKINRYYITLSELYEDSCVSGLYKLFGTPKKELEKIIVGLKEKYGKDLISTDFSADLDNINLNENIHSTDILKITCRIR